MAKNQTQEFTHKAVQNITKSHTFNCSYVDQLGPGCYAIMTAAEADAFLADNVNSVKEFGDTQWATALFNEGTISVNCPYKDEDYEYLEPVVEEEVIPTEEPAKEPVEEPTVAPGVTPVVEPEPTKEPEPETPATEEPKE